MADPRHLTVHGLGTKALATKGLVLLIPPTGTPGASPVSSLLTKGAGTGRLVSKGYGRQVTVSPSSVIPNSVTVLR